MSRALLSQSLSESNLNVQLTAHMGQFKQLVTDVHSRYRARKERDGIDENGDAQELGRNERRKAKRRAGRLSEVADKAGMLGDDGTLSKLLHTLIEALARWEYDFLTDMVAHQKPLAGERLHMQRKLLDEEMTVLARFSDIIVIYNIFSHDV